LNFIQPAPAFFRSRFRHFILFSFPPLGALLAWLLFGVNLQEAILYIGFINFWVVAPGILAYQLLTQRSDWSLDHWGLGVPLGYALLILGYLLGGPVGQRGLMLWFTPLVGGLCLLWLGWRKQLPRAVTLTLSVRESLGLSLILCLALGLLAMRDFPHTRTVAEILLSGSGTDYNRDKLYFIGQIAALKHFWPLTDLRVAGEVLRYHFGTFLPLATASSLTGLEVSTLLNRLDPVWMVILVGGHLFWVGRRFFGTAAGLWSVGLGLLVSDLSSPLFGLYPLVRNRLGEIPGLIVMEEPVFRNNFFSVFNFSPSQTFGMVFLIALVALLSDQLSQRPVTVKGLVLWALVCLGASLAKVILLPLVLLALALFTLGEWAQRRWLFGPIVWPGLIALGAFLLTSDLTLAQGGVLPIGWQPFAALKTFPAWQAITRLPVVGPLTATNDSLRIALVCVLFLLGHAPVLFSGVVLFWRFHAARSQPTARWLMALLSAGFAAYLLLGRDDNFGGGDQKYFLNYAHVPLLLLAGAGVWHSVSVAAPYWRHGLRAVLGAGLVAGFATTVILSVTGLNYLRYTYPPDESDLPPTLLEALLWVRANTPEDSILAVNNQSRLYYRRPFKDFYFANDPATPDYVQFHYSAFTERRIFLEGFGLGQRLAPNGLLAAYADRIELNRRVFELSDTSALELLQTEYHVQYLLVDQRAQLPRPTFEAAWVERVFQNAVAEVYQLQSH